MNNGTPPTLEPPQDPISMMTAKAARTGVAVAHRLNECRYDVPNSRRYGTRMARRRLSNSEHDGSLSASLHCRFEGVDGLRD